MLTHHPVDGWRVRATAGPGAAPPRGPRGGGDRTGHGAHRPARRGAGRRPVRRRRRGARSPGCSARTGATHRGRAADAGATTSGSTSCSPGSTRSRPSRSTASWWRAGEHAPLLPGRRARGGASRGGGVPVPLTVDLALGARARRGRAGADRLPAGRLPAAVQHGAQDGLQLRLGLGARPADRRPLAARDGSSAGGWPGSPRCGRWSRSSATTRRPRRGARRPRALRARLPPAATRR